MKATDLTPGMPVFYTSINGSMPVFRIFTIAQGLLSNTHVSIEEGNTPIDISKLEEVTPASVMKFRNRMNITPEQLRKFQEYWANKKLTIWELAEAIYEGKPAVQNLAEKLARQHGKAQALTFFGMMGEDTQNFYLHIAQQLIDHAKEWEANNGSACVLSEAGRKALKELPRHPELNNRPKMPWEK